MYFKRNQIEDGIASAFEEDMDGSSDALSNRIRRLLDLDRKETPNKRSKNDWERNFAFFGEAPPGKGSEVQFSFYEAFAVSLGLRMLDHSWPQGFIIALIRKARMYLDPEQSGPPWLGHNAVEHKEGKRAVAASAPEAFLAIVFGEGRRVQRLDTIKIVLCSGTDDALRVLKQKPGTSVSVFEIGQSAATLAKALAVTKPAKRGRG